MTFHLKHWIAGLALGLTAATAAQAQEWKFAVEEGPGDVQTLYAQEFKRLVEAAHQGQDQGDRLHLRPARQRERPHPAHRGGRDPVLQRLARATSAPSCPRSRS